MKYIILYFILNSNYYELPLLSEMTREEAIRLELIPKEVKEITKEEFEKAIQSDSKKKNKCSILFQIVLSFHYLTS